jgi:hypothetical protein
VLHRFQQTLLQANIHKLVCSTACATVPECTNKENSDIRVAQGTIGCKDRFKSPVCVDEEEQVTVSMRHHTDLTVTFPP